MSGGRAARRFPAADAEKTFGAAGIDAKTRVVVYDAGTGRPRRASGSSSSTWATTMSAC